MPNPSWDPNAAVAVNYVIIDSNGNVQVASTAGTTGAVEPVWQNVIGATTADGSGTSGSVVTWTCAAVLQIESFPNGVVQLPAPQFLTDADGTDPTLVLSDMISQFQTASGRTLYPAQVERLLINLFAYRELVIRQAIQYTGEQNLLLYANYPQLDYIGQLLGVTREPAQPAATFLTFTGAYYGSRRLGPAGASQNILLPAGTAVGTTDGQFAFVTTNDLTLDIYGQAEVAANCTTPGVAANGYDVGTVSVLLNPNPNVGSVSNATVTSDGAPIETDSHLRTRIQAAPGRFSVAGPVGAYRFWALTADSTIIDAQVITPQPGSVQVYILTGPITQPAASPNYQGIASRELESKVGGVLLPQVPATDLFSVHAVVEVDWNVSGTITCYSDADLTDTLNAANAAAGAYATAQASRIGRDIIRSQLMAAIVNTPGVYDVALTEPSADLIISGTPGQWANCTAITLTSIVNPYEPS